MFDLSQGNFKWFKFEICTCLFQAPERAKHAKLKICSSYKTLEIIIKTKSNKNGLK